jgi:hypothetical protein
MDKSNFSPRTAKRRQSSLQAWCIIGFYGFVILCAILSLSA